MSEGTLSFEECALFVTSTLAALKFGWKDKGFDIVPQTNWRTLCYQKRHGDSNHFTTAFLCSSPFFIRICEYDHYPSPDRLRELIEIFGLTEQPLVEKFRGVHGAPDEIHELIYMAAPQPNLTTDT